MPDYKSLLPPLESITEELTPAEEEVAAKAAAEEAAPTEALKQRNLPKALAELIDTERQYKVDLETFSAFLNKIVEDLEETTSPLASPTTRWKKFQRAKSYADLKKSSELVQKMLEYSEEILGKVDALALKERGLLPIAATVSIFNNVFQEHKAGFEEYYSSYMIVKDSLEKLLSSDDFFDAKGNFLFKPDEVKGSKPCKTTLEVGSFVIKPVQRFLKYSLLFKVIYENSHAAEPVLAEAFSTIGSMARACNETKRLAEEQPKQLAVHQAKKSWMSRSAPALLFSAKRKQSLLRSSSEPLPRDHIKRKR